MISAMSPLSTLVQDLLVILAAGLLAGLVCRRLAVSVLVGYLLVGAIIGTGGLRWVSEDRQAIEYLAEGGVLLLLFSIGLEFTLEDLRRLHRIILVGGGLQMLLVAVPLATLLWLTRSGPRVAWLLGFAVAMSSTVLVFKALAEVGKTGTSAGRRTISILLFQDAAVVPLLLLVPLLAGKSAGGPTQSWIVLILTTVVVVAGVLVLRRLAARRVVPLLARLRSPELTVLFAIVVLGGVTHAVHHGGLPAPLGAFAAGLILSGNRLTSQVDALILSLREPFAAVFFVSLGLLFRPAILIEQPFTILFAFLLVLALKFGAGTVAARATGLSWRPSAGVGMGLAQVGEFAFVLAFTGLDAGLLGEDDYHQIVAIALGTLVLTPSMLKWGLRWAEERRGAAPAAERPSHRLGESAEPAVVIGIGPVGLAITDRLDRQGLHVCAVDLSPVNLHPLAQRGFETLAGDARDAEVLRRAGSERAGLIVVCVPDDEIARHVVGEARKLNKTAIILVRCRFVGMTGALRQAGATAVVSEETEASEALLRTLSTLGPPPSAGLPGPPR